MNRASRFAVVACLVALLPASVGCGASNPAGRSRLVIATTTSAQDSGILEEFVKRFEVEYPYDVKAVAVGSGAALFMGSNGDADVVVTHEPKAEADFMASGCGESIDKVMHNDFIIVGPPSDPAGIKGLSDAAEAAKLIAASGSPFASRGDASGTNAMEMSTWERAGVQPAEPWYFETGQGMGETLRIASDKDAYTMTDRATFIVMEPWLESGIMVEGDRLLVNQYSVTVINPEKFPRVNIEGARDFKEFLLSEETKEFIAGYGRQKYEKRLFYPD